MAEYIKRYDAMKICQNYSTHCFSVSDAKGQDIADKIEDEIAEIPTADVVEVKHAYWQINELKHTKAKFITCSICDSVIDCNYTSIDENEFDFCPYCGAKMDGRRDT